MKLLTKEILKKLPKLYANENKNQDEVIVVCKFFCPWGSGTWYATEFDGEDTFFGLVSMHGEPELGYFSLSELMEIKHRSGLKIERDLWFKPTTLKEVKEKEAI